MQADLQQWAHKFGVKFYASAWLTPKCWGWIFYWSSCVFGHFNLGKLHPSVQKVYFHYSSNCLCPIIKQNMFLSLKHEPKLSLKKCNPTLVCQIVSPLIITLLCPQVLGFTTAAWWEEDRVFLGERRGRSEEGGEEDCRVCAQWAGTFSRLWPVLRVWEEDEEEVRNSADKRKMKRSTVEESKKPHWN